MICNKTESMLVYLDLGQCCIMYLTMYNVLYCIHFVTLYIYVYCIMYVCVFYGRLRHSPLRYYTEMLERV